MTQELEAEPDAAARVFGDRIDVARAFTSDLAERGEQLGLIGPRELPQLWSRHILNSVVLAPLLRGLVADVGSGAGLPGLVLAIARPDISVTLIEPMERRCAWLEEQRDRLELENVRVRRDRAQDVFDERFDQVLARAVSALKTLVPITAPLAADGGELLFLKGARVHDEMQAADKALRKHRVSGVEVLELGGDLGIETTRVWRGVVRANASDA